MGAGEGEREGEGVELMLVCIAYDAFFMHLKIIWKQPMIYRITESPDWLQALRSGQFASADLALEGFIHCSEKHQVLRTATKYYVGKVGLLLLEINDMMLGENVRRENAVGRGEDFPHVYAPIPIAAIQRHFIFLADETGRFILPAALSAL